MRMNFIIAALNVETCRQACPKHFCVWALLSRCRWRPIGQKKILHGHYYKNVVGIYEGRNCWCFFSAGNTQRQEKLFGKRHETVCQGTSFPRVAAKLLLPQLVFPRYLSWISKKFRNTALAKMEKKSSLLGIKCPFII